jgi:hypothetical protein
MLVLAITGPKSDNPVLHVHGSVRSRLAHLTNLTPGDFATVIRQVRILGKQYDAEQLLAGLEEECRAKLSGKKLVRGFMG